MNIIGLDLSMTATGIADRDGHTTTVKSTAQGDRRLLDIIEAVREVLSVWPPRASVDLVAIEDLPRAAMGGAITGMVHGVVRALLLDRATPYVLVPAASVKKFATGKGGAGKPEMAVAAFKRAGVEFGDDNQCDAWWLRAMALHHYGRPLVDLPATHLAALKGVAWPLTPGDET